MTEPMPSPFASRWDRMEGAKGQDYGWIGEDTQGVWIAVHPQAAFLDQPDLWDVVNAFHMGQRELTEHDWETLSSVHYQAKMALLAAHNRGLMHAHAKGQRRNTD